MAISNPPFAEGVSGGIVVFLFLFCRAESAAFLRETEAFPARRSAKLMQFVTVLLFTEEEGAYKMKI